MPASSFDSDPQPVTSEPYQRAPVLPPWYYRAAIGILKPLYRLQVWRRSSGRGNYTDEVNQRFGQHYPPVPTATFDHSDDNKSPLASKQQVIWCHAVSLGETNTATPLLRLLLAAGYQIWLTNTTQTGFARGASLFDHDIKAGRVSHSYVPVDSPAVIETFLAHVSPVAALFIETELWANILASLSMRRIPSILVNARLSATSFSRYQKIAAVSASMMQNLTLIIAQDDESAKRFRQLGAKSAQIRVAGSLKWVVNTPKQLDNDHHKNDKNKSDENKSDENKNQPAEPHDKVNTQEIKTKLASLNRPIWVAASTHDGEEEVMLAWQQQLSDDAHHPLLILVPRHPERFDEVASLIQATGLSMVRRSTNEAIETSTQVFLADSMGELMLWYEAADAALVGGSLVDIGGHNPVEATSVATPVLMGRFTQSCQSVVNKLASVGALYQPHNTHYKVPAEANTDNQVDNSNSNHKKDNEHDDHALMFRQLQFWLTHIDAARQAGLAGKAMTLEHQSVLTRQKDMIVDVLESQKVRV